MNITGEISKSLILENLKLTGVEQLLYNQIHNLSGGEFQRVLIARAVAKKPEFWNDLEFAYLLNNLNVK